MARLQPPLLLAVTNDPLRITSRRRRPLDRLLARSRSLTLDAQLAAGQAPDDDRLRMVRAELLTAPRARRELAAQWESVLDRASHPGNHRRLHTPLQCQQIRGAADAIGRVVEALASGRPVDVQGVAMASLLLTDGTGPLYNPARSADLRAYVSAAADHLDPSRCGRLRRSASRR